MTWKTKMAELSNDSRVVVAASSVTSCAVGAAVAHILTKRSLTAKYAEIADKEIDEAKRYYGEMHEKQRAKSLEEIVEEESPEEKYLYNKYNELANAYSPDAVPDYDEVEEPVVESKVIEKNIFDDPAVYVDEEIMDKDNRDPSVPYIVDKDEFFTNEPEYQQVTLTYYEGDDILADERDRPQDDKSIVGENNLERFGVGSGDPNIVYVRNEVLELDFEICHSDGKYTELVLGFFEHSDSRDKIRRFRGDDE